MISTAWLYDGSDAVMGKQKREVEELAQVFSEMVHGQSNWPKRELGDAVSLSGVSKSHNGLNKGPSPGMLLKSRSNVAIS